MDDNESICEVVKEMLEIEDYQTTIRATGKDAIPYIKQVAPDLILLDVMLDDGIDGREIKAMDELNRIPIVMVSASHKLSHGIIRFCEPDAFIEKPFDMYALLSTVAQQLALRS